MTKRMTLLVVLMFALFSGVLTAQDEDFSEEERELIDYVFTAFENMTELESLSAEGSQTIDQTIEAQGQEIAQTIEQEVTSNTVFGDDVAFESTVIQTLATDMGFQSVEIEMTMDMVFVDDIIWVRVRDASPEVAPMFPADWTNVTENASAVPGMEMLNIDQMLQTTTSALNYPISAETVESIVELDSVEGDDQTLRVFDISLDWEGFIASDEFEVIRGMFNPGAVGVDVDAMMEQMFTGAVIELTVYIGEDDELVHQIDMTMNIDAEIENMVPGVAIVDMIQDLTATFSYFNFNEEMDIASPADE